jgi:cobalt/nickel transport system permease protein
MARPVGAAGLANSLRRSTTTAEAIRSPRPAKPGFVEKTLAGIAGNIEQAIFSEENARRPGFLQRRDPRVKLLSFILLITATAVSRDWQVLAALYCLTLLGAWVSKIDMGLFLKRVWYGIPLFSFWVILPSIFFVGDDRIFTIPLGVFDLAPRVEGIEAAVIFLLRVGACVSLAILLILSTRWADLLKSLRVLGVPNVFVVVLAMTYRYVFLLLHTANGMFLARKSRMVAATSGKEQRWWIVSAIGVLMNRSFRMSEDVFQAMQARGFTDEIRTFSNYRIRSLDVALLAIAGLAAAISVYAGRVWV